MLLGGVRLRSVWGIRFVQTKLIDFISKYETFVISRGLRSVGNGFSKGCKYLKSTKFPGAATLDPWGLQRHQAVVRGL